MTGRKKDIIIYLEDISESSGLIASYIAEISEGAFYDDSEKQDAVIRRIMIIGEAAKHMAGEMESYSLERNSSNARYSGSCVLLSDAGHDLEACDGGYTGTERKG